MNMYLSITTVTQHTIDTMAFGIEVIDASQGIKTRKEATIVVEGERSGDDVLYCVVTKHCAYVRNSSLLVDSASNMNSRYV